MSAAGPGRVRWARFAAALIPALAVTGVLFVLTVEGAMATSFSVAGKPFHSTASSVAGTGFVNYGTTLPTRDGAQHFVAVNAMRTAAIQDFCMQAEVGPVTMVMKAGYGATPVAGTDMAFIVKNFNGDGAMHNVVMGQDAGSLSAVPGYGGTPGGFGMQSDSVTLKGAAMQARELAAGTITMPGFNMAVTRGGGC